jgi:hypothetical protein
MSLSTLAEDVLALILLYLDGHDIAYLQIVGNKRLFLQARRNARSWTVVLRPLAKFPFSALDMPGLQYLDISLGSLDNS